MCENFHQRCISILESENTISYSLLPINQNKAYMQHNNKAFIPNFWGQLHESFSFIQLC